MALTLTAAVDTSWTPPRVRLDVAADAGETSVTVTRLDPDGRARRVRTSDDGPLPISGGAATAYDYEPPYGQMVTYSAGPSSVNVTVDVDEPWLIHPGAPSQSMPVEFRVGTNDEELWDIQQGVFQVLGRATPVVVTGGARTAPASTLIVHATSAAERARLKGLLADGAPLLLNVSPSLGLGIATCYIAVGPVRVRRPSDVGTDQMRDIELPYQVVGRPAGGTQAAITWTDVAAQYATWADVAAAVGTWAELANPTT